MREWQIQIQSTLIINFEQFEALYFIQISMFLEKK